MFVLGYTIVGLTRVLGIAVYTICFMLLIRIILDLFMPRGYYHPIVGYFRDITEPAVGPFRKLFPELGIKLDVVATLVMLVLFFANFFISRELYRIGYGLDGTPYRRHGFVNFLSTLLTVYYYVILFRVLISWVSPDPYNPIVRFLNDVTEPFLRLFRRFIPIWRYGVDFSPFVAILALIFIDISVLGILNRLILGLRS
jgi:YggT family protein